MQKLKYDGYRFQVKTFGIAFLTGSLLVTGCSMNRSLTQKEAEPKKPLVAALEKAGKRLEECKIFLIGFAYKGHPETSDMRDSTTLDLLALLRGRAEIWGFDPVVPASELEAVGVKPCSIEDGFAGADCAIVVNNHRSYADMDIFACLRSMNRPAVYCDCWRVFAPKDTAQVEGVTYLGLGLIVEPS